MLHRPQFLPVVFFVTAAEISLNRDKSEKLDSISYKVGSDCSHNVLDGQLGLEIVSYDAAVFRLVT